MSKENKQNDVIKKNNESVENKNGNKKKSKKKRKKRILVLKITLLIIFVALIIVGGSIAGMVLGIIKSSPEIDPTNFMDTLSESSVIVDESGNVIEQIHDPNENREIIKLSNIPKNLQNAFIAIEDERFRTHFGIDIKRIFGSLIHNVKVGDLTSQGASTITQQLIKNLYFTSDKLWERKIQEMYLATQVERKLSKDLILEGYLNTIPLGQSAYGVQTAAYTYFSKDVSELTLAESAMLAGAAKGPMYALFNRYNLNNIDDIPQEDIIGYVYIGSVQYACVYNENAKNRQLAVLNKMLELGSISQEEYDESMSVDMRVALNPGQTKIEGISSSPMDYVKEKVVEDIMEAQGKTYEEAENILYRGGLTITTTLDVNMQKSLEDSYDNFSTLLLGKEPTGDNPVAQDWRYFRWSQGQGTGMLDTDLNILNENGQLIYYAKDNIMDGNNAVYLNPDEYSYDNDGNLIINSKKFDIYASVIDIVDAYTVDDKLNFVSHSIGALNIGNNFEVLEKKGTKGSFKVPKSYLEKTPESAEMFKVGSDNVLRIEEGYFFFQEKGIVQPQSATVILDYKTGKIKALIGGRDIEGSKTFNRAVDAARQPGSTIKPLSVYLPALDMGYTAAYILDDLPKYNEKGERWPKNWYEHREIKYHGITTLRKSIEQSINTNAVTMLETIGTEAAMNSLTKLGLINANNPEKDTFVSPAENTTNNDVNLASLALGGLTKGFTPLGMTAAYGAIANDGVYIEPYAYTKVVNSTGETILEKIPETHVVVTPEVASLMKDILRSTVNPGLSYKAKLPAEMGIEVAGKTGTTQANGDFWFVGFSPYYVGGVWVGNDNVQMKLSGDSGITASLWSGIMTPIHQGLPAAKFVLNPNLIPVQVCSQSGKLPGELCALDQRGSQIITEYFVPGTQPTEICDVHVKVEICTSSNMLKSPYCPGNLVEERVFIMRNPLFDPEAKSDNYEAKKLYQQVLEDRIIFSLDELRQIYAGQVEFDNNSQVVQVMGVTVDKLGFSGYLTEDYKYQVPTKMCTYHTKWHYDQWMDEENPGNNNGDNEDDEDSTDDIIDDLIESGNNENNGNNGNGNSNSNSDSNSGNGNGNNNGSALDDILESIEN
ncbi:transglycosylase domain-containing protein [Sedimentibacter hydroxybenzoicus DSM 7310]|uniref:Transglycosylase domain-containing protein n=1 Tax=Sedimentibacter hydroxybenzoicus DSM 7310 TaxID=1123245 RepID=A0A974BNI7_SEDHY|nr:transglycosylase domain-containing protein [Sedimentibacter hydroxybenzoicus]NYB76025.1 transglycosylase domain-containing protein [Sedimentibacter hydroxybenzoicus DSM 7310]